MKRRKLIMVALGLGALITLKQPSFADDATAAAPPAGGTTAPAAAQAPVAAPAPGRHMRTRVNAFDRLATALSLTDDQKTKVKPLFLDEGRQMREVRRDTTLTPEQQKDKAKTIQDTTVQQINALLTPDQQTKYQEYLASFKAQRRQARANANAAAAPAAPAASAAPAAPANP